MPDRILVIAKICHEANRIYCESIGDLSQPKWEDAPDWQVTSARDGVLFHIDNPSASVSASHEQWMGHKVRDGWIYGEKKDAEAKTHPCMVPFDELPPSQQTKDYIFRAIVHGFREAQRGHA